MKSNENDSGNRGNVRRRRRGTRVAWLRPVFVDTGDGDVVMGHTTVISQGGVGLRLTRELDNNQMVKLFFLVESQWHECEGKVVFCRKTPNERFPRMMDIGVFFSNPNFGAILWQRGRANLST